MPILGETYEGHYIYQEITNVFMDVKWYFPKMKNGHILATPLRNGDNPPCAYFVKEISRQSEIIQYAKLM